MGRSGNVRVAARVIGSLLAALLITSTAATAQKNPYRTYTEEKFVQNMQTASRNYAAVTELLAKSDYESAKAQLTRAREQLAITMTFWQDRKKDDAVTLLRNALERTDELDTVLSADSVEPAAVNTAAQRMNASCQACHSVYRDQNPATKAYRVKPGSLQ
jgi:cytochrome c556